MTDEFYQLTLYTASNSNKYLIFLFGSKYWKERHLKINPQISKSIPLSKQIMVFLFAINNYERKISQNKSTNLTHSRAIKTIEESSLWKKVHHNEKGKVRGKKGKGKRYDPTSESDKATVSGKKGGHLKMNFKSTKTNSKTPSTKTKSNFNKDEDSSHDDDAGQNGEAL